LGCFVRFAAGFAVGLTAFFADTALLRLGFTGGFFVGMERL
jgi:hypothetical protein